MALLLWISCSVPAQSLDSGTTEHPARDTLVALEGRVLDTDGGAIEGALLLLTPGGYEAWTDGDGAFRLEALPQGPAELVVRAEGHARWTRELALQRDRELQVVLDAEPALAGSLQVEVLGPDGLPLEHATVEAAGLSATTDETGLTRLGPLGGAAFELEVRHPELWARRLEGLWVDEQGGLQLVVQLAGRSDEAEVVGSAFCLACHPEHVDAWEDSAHARTLDPVHAALATRFESGERVELGDGVARLATVEGRHQVELVDLTGEARSYEVEGLIGEVPWIEDGGRAWPLPLVWMAEDPERPGFPDSEARLEPWQVERWFDEQGRFVDRAPEDSAEAACFPCHATGWTASEDGEGGLELLASSGEGRFLEEGVGCERCHGPGSEHIAARDERKPFLITNPAHVDRGEVCRGCHGALEAHEGGWPFALAEGEPARPGADLDALAASAPKTWSSGAAAAPGQQADELRDSAHAALACADCHAVHDDEGQGTASRESMLDNGLCASCHVGLSFDGDERAMELHTGHRYEPTHERATSRCIACHMPATAARTGHGAATGDGDRHSHTFVALAPAETLAEFAGESAAIGTFPAHACGSCHAWNAWLAEDFGGVDGEPTERSTHEAHQRAFEQVFP